MNRVLDPAAQATCEEIFNACLPEIRRSHPAPDDPAYLRWKSNLMDEIGFWYKHIADNRYWYADFISQINAPTPGFIYHTFEYAKLLAKFGEREIRVLDLGCGPLLTLGLVWNGRDLRITRYDALGCVYRRLLQALDLDAQPLRSITGEAENIATVFAKDSFHLAFSRNALDHCYDPMKAIAGMYEVTKVGGVVLLRHLENEGASGKYGGLHQWNFSIQRRRPILWNQRERIDIVEHLPWGAKVTARRYKGIEKPQARRWVDVTIRKR